jgi:molybdate/tungstate transport system ATP-binding protein
MIDAKIRAHQGQFQLSAEIKASGITCVVGKNGSGKTTLLKTLGGFLPVDEGYVTIGGVDVTRLPVEKRGVVMVTPDSHLPHLDVNSHLTWGARLRGRRPGHEEVSKIKQELGIDFGGQVKRLSLGMRERVSLATALLAEPKAILVDEAFSSLHNREDFIVTYGRLLIGAHVDLVFASQDEVDARLAGTTYMMRSGATSVLG